MSDTARSSSIRLVGMMDSPNTDTTSNFFWAEFIFELTSLILMRKDPYFFGSELQSIDSIDVEVRDTSCDGFTALEQYWEAKEVPSRLPIHAIVGARCSGASIPLAWMGNFDGIPQISMSSTSAKLSDKEEFPYFSRLVAPDDGRGFVGAMIATLDLLEWDRVSIIHTDTPYSKDLYTEFRGLWEGDVAYSATVERRSDGTVDEASALKALEEAPLDDPANNSKAILLLTHDEDAYKILELAYRENFPEETFWMGPWVGRQPPPGWMDWMPDIPGYLGVSHKRVRTPVYDRFLSLAGSYLDGTGILDADGNLPDYTAEYTVDAIIAMTLALAKTPVADRTNARAVTDNLRNLDFDGLSGNVRFTPEGDRRDPQFAILNLKKKRDVYAWEVIGSTGTEIGSAEFGDEGVAGICFAGLGCGLDEVPSEKPPVPRTTQIWVSVVMTLLCLVFLAIFCVYRRRKILASRKTKAILAAKEKELEDFQNSVVDMCTAEAQYVPAHTKEASSEMMEQAVRVQWCWGESGGKMAQWEDKMIEGDRSEAWIRYDDASNIALELAYQEQGHAGTCVPRSGYTVDFGKMIQTNDATGFERDVKRVEASMPGQDGNAKISRKKPPKSIRKEPQMVLVPGDIVQISKKRKDKWAYGSKLHLEDEPLSRRLVLQAYAEQDIAYGNNDERKMIISDKNGWFPMGDTRAPNTDDLAILRKTLGGADDLAPPDSWDRIVDPSVVQKSDPLDKSTKEYKDVKSAFLSTLPSETEIVSIERIQNVAMWQSYLVKRKTIVDREKNKRGLTRRWLWHGTNEDSVEKIIQQGFNRSFCGKNATSYGKGVYFARDASYSSYDRYTPPDEWGFKYILACSVVVGEFCPGKVDARIPDLRDATKNLLYDSTVDTLENPELYVTYHDAQAYPEYLIKFKNGF